MKNLKFGVLAFGVLGVIGLFMSHWLLIFQFDKGTALLLMLGFVLPAAMGIMGVTKPPFQKWQAAVGAAGFALIFIKSKMWEAVKGIGDTDIGGKLVIISCIAGLIVAILAIVKSEEA